MTALEEARDEILAAIEGDLPNAADLIRSRILDVEGLAAMPPPEWLVQGWLSRDALAVLYGKPGLGKTFAALAMALHLADGSSFFGHAVEDARTLYVAGEGVSAFAQRIAAWQTDRQVDRLAGFYAHRGPIPLREPAYAVALGQVASELGVGLVVVDTLSRCMAGGDENSPRDMGAFVAGVDVVRTVAGCAVLILHHDSRAGGAPRGHSSLDGAADQVLSLTGAEGRVQLRAEKVKDGAEPHPLDLKLVSVGTSAVLVRADPNADTLTPGALEVLRTLDEIADADGVSASVWERSVQSHDGVGRSTFYRSVKTLTTRGWCHVLGDTNRKRYVLSDLGKQALERSRNPEGLTRSHQVPSDDRKVGLIVSPPL